MYVVGKNVVMNVLHILIHLLVGAVASFLSRMYYIITNACMCIHVVCVCFH
jgi:hypothetical protein